MRTPDDGLKTFIPNGPVCLRPLQRGAFTEVGNGGRPDGGQAISACTGGPCSFASMPGLLAGAGPGWESALLVPVPAAETNFICWLSSGDGR